MYLIQGTRKSSQCIDNFSDIDFLKDNSADSDEPIQYWSDLCNLKVRILLIGFYFIPILLCY